MENKPLRFSLLKTIAMSVAYLVLLPLLFLSCDQPHPRSGTSLQKSKFETIGAIPVPEGYTRTAANISSFGSWLRKLSIKKDNHVYLYNGSLKKNQSAQYAVLDVSVGKKDLQQCADAVMRMRADYLFSEKRYSDIAFMDNNGKSYPWRGGHDSTSFTSYLETVFGWCGSASLEKQLRAINDKKDIRPGDVLIQGGFPGHAMLVADVAVSKEGKKIFMLAQSYMPAQDIHIVVNPLNNNLSPWYEWDADEKISTPEWIFKPGKLRRW